MALPAPKRQAKAVDGPLKSLPRVEAMNAPGAIAYAGKYSGIALAQFLVPKNCDDLGITDECFAKHEDMASKSDIINNVDASRDDFKAFLAGIYLHEITQDYGAKSSDPDVVYIRSVLHQPAAVYAEGEIWRKINSSEARTEKFKVHMNLVGEQLLDRAGTYLKNHD